MTKSAIKGDGAVNAVFDNYLSRKHCLEMVVILSQLSKSLRKLGDKNTEIMVRLLEVWDVKEGNILINSRDIYLYDCYKSNDEMRLDLQ